MGRPRNDDYLWDDDEDGSEVCLMEPFQTTANQRFFHIPTFEKCPHCNDEGSIEVSRMTIKSKRNRESGEHQVCKYRDCDHCDGMGYLNVPSSEAAAKEALDRNKADLVLIRKRQFLTRGFVFWG